MKARRRRRRRVTRGTSRAPSSDVRSVRPSSARGARADARLVATREKVCGLWSVGSWERTTSFAPEEASRRSRRSSGARTETARVLLLATKDTFQNTSLGKETQKTGVDEVGIALGRAGTALRGGLRSPVEIHAADVDGEIVRRVGPDAGRRGRWCSGERAAPVGGTRVEIGVDVQTAQSPVGGNALLNGSRSRRVPVLFAPLRVLRRRRRARRPALFQSTRKETTRGRKLRFSRENVAYR